jgi:hypothetical protein
MPNRKKLKISLISAFALIITIMYPAQAVAPKAELKQVHKAIAKSQPKNYAKIKMVEYGWGKKQSTCLNRLWGKESAWNHLADNPTSSAFGIAQMLGEKSTDPMVQINNGLRYIKHRYDTPCNAWRYWQRNNWY